MAADRNVTLGRIVADLVDAAPGLKVQQPPAASSPAAPNKASPAAQQKASGDAVLSHVTLGSKPKAYDYFTGLDEQSRAWLYPRLREAVRSRVCFVVSSKRDLLPPIGCALTYILQCRCSLREREASRLLATENCATKI